MEKKLKLENYSKNSSHIISHFLHIRTDIYEGRRKVFLAFLSVVAAAAAIRAEQNNNTNNIGRWSVRRGRARTRAPARTRLPAETFH